MAQTYDDYLQMVRKNGYDIHRVPQALRDADMLVEAVKQAGDVIQLIPENLRTAVLCLEAVRQNGWALLYVPEGLRTPELCLEAVKQDGMVFANVPKPARTHALLVTAIRQLASTGVQAPTAWCLEAVQSDGLVLKHLRYTQRTPEICLAAFKQNRESIMYIPENQREQVQALALGHVDSSEPSAEYAQWLAAVKREGNNLIDVPLSLRTHEMCKAAIEQNPFACRFLPAALSGPLREEAGEDLLALAEKIKADTNITLAHIAKAFNAAGWKTPQSGHIDMGGIFTRDFETAVGSKQASILCNVLGSNATSARRIIMQGTYSTEGRNALAVITQDIAIGSDEQDITGVVDDMSRQAVQHIDKSYARALYLQDLQTASAQQDDTPHPAG